MKFQKAILLFPLLWLLTGVGCGNTAGNDGAVEEVKASETFSDWTTCEEFQQVPVMLPEGCQIGTAVDSGGDTQVLDVNGTTLEDYRAYLARLEEDGFVLFADNGEEGLNGNVYTATYIREELTLTVTHMVKFDKTYLAASLGRTPSSHLLYQEEYTSGNVEGAKTTLHLMELYDNGNSFVIQLKNGHFIINDGGNPEDLPYLLDYLDSLAPEGEKPVIEAWVFSHAHADHVGAFNALMTDMDYVNRFYLWGVYFCEPGEELLNDMDASDLMQTVQKMEMITDILNDGEGNAPGFYRLQTGQRYYFNDITMEVVLTLEQMKAGNLSNDYNDTSTWLKFVIEDQDFLVCGDADYGSVDIIMNCYDQDYFDLDLFAVFHHGINMFDDFHDWCSIRTVLYTNYRCGSLYPDTSTHAHTEEQEHLIGLAQEAMSHGKGTKVLAFPYTVGTAVTAEPIEWKYETDGLRTFDGAWGERYEEFEDYIINQ